MSYAIYTTNWSKAFFVAFSGICFSLLLISSKFNSFIRLLSSLILLSLLSIRCCTCSIFYLSSFDIPPAATGFLYIGLTPYLFYYILPSTSSYNITCCRIFNSFIKSSWSTFMFKSLTAFSVTILISSTFFSFCCTFLSSALKCLVKSTFF